MSLSPVLPHRTLVHRFVETIPDRLEPGVLYISTTYGTVTHACCCGCGEEVVTPLTPTDWAITFNGESVSLWPSVGNWNSACRSHYIVRHGRVLAAEPWTDEDVAAERRRDRAAKAHYFALRGPDGDSAGPEDTLGLDPEGAPESTPDAKRQVLEPAWSPATPLVSKIIPQAPPNVAAPVPPLEGPTPPTPFPSTSGAMTVPASPMQPAPAEPPPAGSLGSPPAAPHPSPLGATPVEEHTFTHDVELGDRYQRFSEEMARLALLGLSAIAFLLVSLKIGGEHGESVLLKHLADIQWWLYGTLTAFAATVGCALVHRYYATDSLATQLEGLRLLRRGAAGDVERAAAAEKARNVAFRRARRFLGLAAVSLGAGAVALAATFSLAVYYGFRV